MENRVRRVGRGSIRRLSGQQGEENWICKSFLSLCTFLEDT